MQEITAYFGEIIVITAISGILFTAAPEGNIKKYINFVLSVCILAAVIAPMLGVIAKLPSEIRYREDDFKDVSADEKEHLESALVSASKKEIERAIGSLVCTKFGFDDRSVTVDITLDDRNKEAIEIIKIQITVPDGTKKKEISSYMSDMFLGKSKILVEEGRSS